MEVINEKNEIKKLADEINKNEQDSSLTKKSSKKVYFVIKRLFDIIFGVMGMFLIIPVALIVKISYLLTGDTKPIFYKQKRIGKNGKTIYIYKFRSMVYNADEMLKNLLKDPVYREEWDKNQKLMDDPRITKVGKLLRQTSLDELPQFFNILKGDMSLIGPRPLVEKELDSHFGNHEIYESVCPRPFWMVGF